MPAESSTELVPEPQQAPPTTARSEGGRVSALVLSSLAIGAANYGMSWVAVRLMPAEQFARYAAAQGILLVLGTGSLAAVPWAVARFVARTSDPTEQSAGLRFGLLASAAQAAVIGPLAFVLTWRLIDLPLGASVGASAVFISLLAAPSGWLQGLNDIRGLVVIRCLEVAARVTVALGFLLVVTRSALPAVGSFAIGAAVALTYGLWRARHAFPVSRIGRENTRALVRQAVALGGIQILLAALGAMDTVYVAASGLTVNDEASYQAAALFARIPLFFSSAISIAVFARLAAARSDREVSRGLTESLRSFAWLSVPTLLVCLTLPAPVLHLLVPAAYDHTAQVLRVAGVTGVLVGAVNVITTAQQARLLYRRCLAVLAGAVVLQGVALNLAGFSHNVMAFTVSGLAVLVLATSAVTFDARRWLVRPAWRWTPWCIPVVTGSVAAGVFRSSPVLWFLAVGVAGVACVVVAFRAGVRSNDPGPEQTSALSVTGEQSW